jgi:CheY-like chemotaxis protein
MNRQQVKILIIDDEKPILGMLSKRLDRFGFAVDVAENAELGIDKISSHPYDLILTDIKMPGMSGDDVFQYVRTNLEKPIPVIAMSGTPWLLRNSNFDAVVAKPFCKEELLDVISQFVPIAQP